MFCHVLLEVYCSLGCENEDATPPAKCNCCDRTPTYKCLFNKCPYVAFTSCENALCYIGEDSVADEIIAFGGEMEDLQNANSSELLNLWKHTATNKIKEAYEQYMNQKDKVGNLTEPHSS